MQAGDYQRARPLLEKAVRALRGSGVITEAYASYNLAYTRFALGICGGVLRLLDRSEAIQGRHPDIDALRQQAFSTCVGGGRRRRRRRRLPSRERGEDLVGLGEATFGPLREDEPPSPTTSNCPVSPGVAIAPRPSFASISSARLTARASYPFQVGQ